MIKSEALAGRRHRGPATVPLALPTEARAHCEALLRAGTTERRVAQRAQALLLLADGVDSTSIAAALGVHQRTVFKWKLRFDVSDPVSKLTDAPGAGRPISLFPTPRRRASSLKRVARRAT
jgi:hypothetical protein